MLLLGLLSLKKGFGSRHRGLVRRKKLTISALARSDDEEGSGPREIKESQDNNIQENYIRSPILVMSDVLVKNYSRGAT